MMKMHEERLARRMEDPVFAAAYAEETHKIQQAVDEYRVLGEEHCEDHCEHWWMLIDMTSANMVDDFDSYADAMKMCTSMLELDPHSLDGLALCEYDSDGRPVI